MLWYLVTGAMELSWFFAWAMFSSAATMGRPFPFFETVIAFALAVSITRVSTGKGWRVVQILGLQVVSFLCAALMMVHRLYYSSYALLDRGWLFAFFNGPKGAQEWLILLMNIFLILVLWAVGVTFAGRARRYYVTCRRFDFGLAAFLALCIVKLIALTKGGVTIQDPLSLLFVFPFFLFSLLAIGMVRIDGTALKAFLPGYRGLGVIASFFAVVLLGAGGLILFFLPALTAVAQMGYRALRVAGEPLGYVFVTAVRFMFMPRGSRSEAAAEPSHGINWDMIKPGPQSWWVELLEEIIGWGLWGFVLLTLLAVAGIAAFCALKWLFSRTSVSNERRRPRDSISLWLSRLWASLVGFLRNALRGVRGYQKAAELYSALLGWARRSGLPHVLSETPIEFGARLNGRFPGLKPQIELIIGGFNQEVYGEAALSHTQVAAIRSAWCTLRSPVHWPLRVKGGFFRS
ncbi:MAG: DUF4129 domain-containing protein [Syntrophales bacterium LBB04]|nr:DUF4129 domain-containing protein [Syntrophales bacterium LBB04]